MSIQSQSSLPPEGTRELPHFVSDAQFDLRSVEKLTPERRSLIMLRYSGDFNIGQIAKILNIPEGTVKSRLHRTVNELRQLVERNKNE